MLWDGKRGGGGGTSGGSPAALGSQWLHSHGVEQGEVAGTADGQRPRRVVPHGFGHRGEGGPGVAEHEVLLPRPCELHVHEAVAAPAGGEGKLRHAARGPATLAHAGACLRGSRGNMQTHASTWMQAPCSQPSPSARPPPLVTPPRLGCPHRRPRVPHPLAPRSPERERVVVGAGLAVPHQKAALAAQRQQRLGARSPDGAVVPPARRHASPRHATPWRASPWHPAAQHWVPRTHLQRGAPSMPRGTILTTWTHR